MLFGFYNVDICHLQNLEQLFIQFSNIDTVYHTAAVVRMDDNYPLLYNVNVVGTQHVINVAVVCVTGPSRTLLRRRTCW